MSAILASISAGGLVGVSNQYLYLLLICLGGRFNLFGIPPQMQFMTQDWFMILVGALWLVSVAPSYAPLIAPGLANAANTVSNFMHGFVVPATSALIALAASGFVTMSPEVQEALGTIRLFDPATGALEPTGYAVAGGGALLATTLTGARFLAKPGVAAATGTQGHVSAPAFATLEQIGAVLVAVGVYYLTKLDPWWLVAFAAVIAISVLVVLVIGLVALYRMGKGIGRLFHLIQEQPRAGWSLVAEALVWGSGSLIWNQGSYAALRFVLWLCWIAVLVMGTLLWAVPVVGWAIWLMILTIGFGIGIMFARGLLRRLEKSGEAGASVPAARGGMVAAAP